MTLTPEAQEERPPEREAQREWEGRVGRLVAVAAFISAALAIAGFLVQAVVIKGRSNNADDFLRTAHENQGSAILAAVLDGVAVVLLAVVLWYLYRVTRYRRPELVPLALILAIVGPLLAGVVLVVREVEITHVARDFAALPAIEQSKQKGEDMLKSGSLPALNAVSLAANVAMGFGLVLINLNAMRAGILSRFLGILGVIMGVLYVLPLGPPQLLQLFWLGALGLIFLNRWPSGRGPAWEKMVAVPWPTQMEVRAEQARARAAGNGAPSSEEAEEAAPRPASRKRKRKKRNR